MKKILFFFTELDGRVRQIVNGVVTSLTKKTPLEHNPDGTMEIVIIFERDMNYFGLMKNFTLPLGYYRESATILRNDFYKFNVDRKLSAVIKIFKSELTADYYKEYYKFLYKGDFDFTTFNDKPKDHKVEIGLMEGGVRQLIKAAETTQFAFPFDNDHVNILFDGVYLFQQDNFITQSGLTAADHVLGTLFINKDGNAYGIVPFTVFMNNNGGGGIDFTTSLDYFEESSQNVNSVFLDIHIKCNFTRITGGDCVWSIKTNTGRTIDIHTYSGGSGPVEFTESIEFDMLEGERFFLFCHPSGVNSVEYEETELAVRYKTKKASTFVKAFQPYVLYKKICVRAGVSPNKIISEKLKACTYFITCGDALRGIDGAQVKTSFKDFFKSFNVYSMLGYSVEHQSAVIEDRARYFDATDPIPLGDVVLNEIKPAVDLYYSRIKVGHAEQDVDDVNGKSDFNGYMIFTSPIKRFGDKELDLQAVYSAGPYEMETMRINLEGKTTTDSSNDNKVYVADVVLGSAVIMTEAGFIAADNIIVFPLGTDFVVGQRFQVEGSVNNEKIFTVNGAVETFIGVFVGVAEAVTDEASVPVSITFLTGQVYTLDRSVAVDSGVMSPETVFNVRLSPKRLLMVHFPWLKIPLDKYLTDKLIFESANRNSDMIAGGIIESADVNINTMGPALAMPYYFSMLTKVNPDLPDIMQATPNKAFTFISDRALYTGFAMKVGIAPYDGKPQDYNLLAAPGNDIESLILLGNGE